MDIVRFFDRRVRYNIAAFGLLIATVVPSLVPAIASAAQLTQRSLTLSSSSANAPDVTYKVNFTAVQIAGAFVVEFCSNSPTVGDTCSAPGGFDSSAAAPTAASTSAGVTAVGQVGSSTSQVLVTDSITAGQNVSVELTGIHNPTLPGALYARVVTYDTAGDAANYTSTVDTTTGGVRDFGGIATYITDTVGVSAQVLETMEFCTAKSAISADCDLSGNLAPTLKLGETSGNTVALTSSAVSTGTIYTQISTNAVSGAVVSMKSDATGCGGMLLAGDPSHCYIGPAQQGGISQGQALFGVKLGAATAVGGGSGTYEPVTGSGYNTSTYTMNYVSNDATGVTSPYGDPILDTHALPVNNMNMPLTFGASVSNLTPAGTYSADLSLIATGTF